MPAPSGTTGSVVYDVPSLGVALTASPTAAARQVVATLTYSPRAAVLSGGRPPAVPSGWEGQSIEGLAFSTPASWPVHKSTIFTGCRSYVALGVDGVLIDTDEGVYMGSCVQRDQSEVVPTDGVEINTGSAAHVNQMPPLHASPLHLGGVTAFVVADAQLDILQLTVLVPGRTLPLDVEIGLAGDGSTARTILYSLRAA